MKISIQKNDLWGPGVFLTRLERELSKMNVYSNDEHDVIIGTENIDTTKKFILRLDGINFEWFSAVEFSNFLRYRWKPKIRRFSGFSNFLSPWAMGKFERYITPYLTKYWFSNMNRSVLEGIKKADAIIYQSNFSLDSYSYFCDDFGEHKYSIITNGVCLNQFSPEKGENGMDRNFGEDHLNILSSGKFRIHKRLQDSILLLEKIIEEVPEARLFVLGQLDEQTYETVTKLVLKRKLQDHIVFMGKVHFDELPALYASMDVMLHPSWVDSCPNVVVESLASGTPVICPSTGGTPELVGNGGIIVDEEFEFGFKEYYNLRKIPPIDQDKYLEAVMNIHGNKEHYSEKARARAEERLNIENIADDYIKVCSNVCES